MLDLNTYLGTGLSAIGRVPISNPRGGVAEIDAKGGVRGGHQREKLIYFFTVLYTI